MSIILKNIDHYFLLLPDIEFIEFYCRKINITLDKAKYNLVKKKYEV